MDIKILFNDTAISDKFVMGKGFSCLIDNHILFDTGTDYEFLKKNMDLMNVDINNIDKVIISHEHLDHAGGLEGVLKQKTGLKVFGCTSFNQDIKKSIVDNCGLLYETGHMVLIEDNIFVTGEIGTVYKGEYLAEQSVIIRTENGLSVIAGCAHAGIDNIVGLVKEHFPDEEIFAVIGGFHLHKLESEEIYDEMMILKELRVKKIVPMHCSGDLAKNIAKDIFRNNFIDAKSGDMISI